MCALVCVQVDRAAAYVHSNLPRTQQIALLSGGLGELFKFTDAEPTALDVIKWHVWVKAVLQEWPRASPAEHLAGGIVLKFDDGLPMNQKVSLRFVVFVLLFYF